MGTTGRLWNTGGANARAVIAAHPDDEVIGAGGQLPIQPQRWRIVHVTDGSPRNLADAQATGFRTRAAYAHARQAEALAALRFAAIPAAHCHQLGIVDQEASLDLVDLTRRIARLLEAERIGLVLTHPYEGGHPDHDATAFAVHAAVRLLRRDAHHRRLVLIREMTSYHAGPAGLCTGDFLPARPPIAIVPLSCLQRRIKRAMLRCFATQQRVLDPFSDVGRERFRRAPRYRFDRPPHAGRLWYEQFDWGMDGLRWRMLASRALADLGLEPWRH